jgi:hypothetical protein
VQPPDTLAHFQSRLLEELWAGRGAEETRAALLADGTLAPFHAYIAGMELEMLDVAADLVRKWGVGLEGS